MKITTVFYSRTYPTAMYANEKIGLEALIEEDETVTGVLDVLKKMCDAEHKANNPHLYQEEQVINITQPIEQTVKPKDDRIGRYLAIQAATTLEELEAVKIQPEDKLDIPYNTQKKKLQAK